MRRGGGGWTGECVRLRGIEPDDWAAFQRFAAEEARSGDLPRPPGSAEGYRAWAKEQAVAAHRASVQLTGPLLGGEQRPAAQREGLGPGMVGGSAQVS
ncbi:hypothetical protein [Streptomyces sp. NPDC015345]|uniref:hypothetical protein n=1 Tax=Streptomyces sp. NPDC015345 TaxID=3364953 RepID=UPI0037014CE8